MTPRYARLAAAFLVVAIVVAGAGGVSGVSLAALTDDGSSPPPAVDDRAAFTLRTEGVYPGADGRICADRKGEDLNEVVVTDSRVENVTLWHEGERATRLNLSSGTVDRTVLYTNGENERVNTLATLDACVAIPQTEPITVEAYYVETETLTADNGTVVTSPAVDDEVPEPGGLLLGDLRDEGDGESTPAPSSTPTPTPSPAAPPTPSTEPVTPPQSRQPTAAPAPDPSETPAAPETPAPPVTPPTPTETPDGGVAEGGTPDGDDGPLDWLLWTFD